MRKLKEAVNAQNEDAVLDLNAVETTLESLFQGYGMTGDIEGGVLKFGYLDDGDAIEITEEGKVSYDGLFDVVTNVFSDDSEISDFMDMDDLKPFLSNYANAFGEVMEALDMQTSDDDDSTDPDDADDDSTDADSDDDDSTTSESSMPTRGDRVAFEYEGGVYGGEIVVCQNLSEEEGNTNWMVCFIDGDGEAQAIIEAYDGATGFQFSRPVMSNVDFSDIQELSDEDSEKALLEGITTVRTIHGLKKQRTGFVHHTAAQKRGYLITARKRARAPHMSASVRAKIARGNIKAHRLGLFNDRSMHRNVNKYGLNNSVDVSSPKNPFLGESKNSKKK